MCSHKAHNHNDGLIWKEVSDDPYYQPPMIPTYNPYSTLKDKKYGGQMWEQPPPPPPNYGFNFPASGYQASAYDVGGYGGQGRGRPPPPPPPAASPYRVYRPVHLIDQPPSVGQMWPEAKPYGYGPYLSDGGFGGEMGATPATSSQPPFAYPGFGVSPPPIQVQPAAGPYYDGGYGGNAMAARDRSSGSYNSYELSFPESLEWKRKAKQGLLYPLADAPMKTKTESESERERSAPKPKGINMEEIIADPDGDGSSLCAACTLPIFSTPSLSFSHAGQQLFLHTQCAGLPQQLLHELHPNHTLLLQQPAITSSTPTTCSNCKRVCGSVFYQCCFCEFRLDLVCALQIKIKHRSHHHAMMVIRQREASSLTCSACDSKHDSPSSETASLSYLCNFCGFWIHPDCASLPNAIAYHENHQHCLFLTYDDLPSAAAQYNFKCGICSNQPKKSSGVYICLNCPDYLVHFRCALSGPKSFKPVFLREAKAADLCRLPPADETTSLIPYIREGCSDGDESNLLEEKLHDHPLIFHGIDDHDDQYSSPRVCNACVQSVQPPFFSCPQCPHFFLHSCCAHLPTMIYHRLHRNPLILHPKPPKSDISEGFFTCKGCQLRCNGFAYSCESCHDFTLDVCCALISPAITHDSHKKTHILFMCRDTDFGSDQICNCCNSKLSGICYECNICLNFKLHVRCALLPNTVRHMFDKHPLQLTTTGDGGDELCEVCEEGLDTKRWYYSCGECNQSFHIDCIPSVDRLSRIKLGSTVRIDGHGCAVALTRQVDVGLRCGGCRKMMKSSSSDNGLAYECSNCFYGIHHDCAQNCLS